MPMQCPPPARMRTMEPDGFKVRPGWRYDPDDPDGFRVMSVQGTQLVSPIRNLSWRSARWGARGENNGLQPPANPTPDTTKPMTQIRHRDPATFNL